MSFQNFLSGLKDKMSELKTEALKFKNRDFMNAAMSGAALISMADGEISSEEKKKMIQFIENHDALSVFATPEVIKSFQGFVSQIEFDKDIGEAKAYEALRKLKSNDAASRLVMRMIISIAGSDGNFDDSEKRVARLIANELALNPADFELV
ncbi:MAG: tellurite resistance TerB family protein [Methylococcaceae bacterium]|nr:tellurite resistance TerB family protein [Methylococcaceae bacterium]